MNGLEIEEKRKIIGFTQQELADKLGVSLKTIGNWEGGSTIPKTKLKMLESFFESEMRNISDNSKITHVRGHENVKTNEEFENKNGNKFIELPNGQFYMLMPLAEFKIQAGLLSHYQDADFLMDLGTYGLLVEKPVQGRYIAFRVSGDSMDDGSSEAIPRNSIVSTRELQRHLWTSKLRYKDFPYWVIYSTQSKMPLLKEIIDHNVEEGYIVCHSLNDSPEFQDFKLYMNDIQALFYVIDKTTTVSKKLAY